MIIEQSGLKGIKSELNHLDEVSSKLGFVRWQWEYYRATYDYRIENDNDEYFLRVNTRAIDGKLESPHAVLVVEDAYIGITTFPHGLNYEIDVPKHVMSEATNKLQQLQQQLS